MTYTSTMKVAEPVTIPPVNEVKKRYVSKFDPVFLEYYNKYSVGRLTNNQIPIEDFRKYPERYNISYGRMISLADVKTKDLSVPVEGGEISVRMYEPLTGTDANRPAYINYHGGGWVFGGLFSDSEICKEIVDRVGCVVFDVDYRLAPEFPFPIPVEDSWSAFKWIVANSHILGVDKNRIAVGGLSAGGHLSAIIAQRARDENLGLKLQILGVPALDATAVTRDGFAISEDCPYPSWKENDEVPYLNFDRMSWFYRHFLGTPRPKQYDDNPSVSPMHCKNLKGLARTVIWTAELDVLRDEGEAYGKLLEKNGVEVLVRRFKGVPHPFLHMAGILEAGKECLEMICSELRTSFYE